MRIFAHGEDPSFELQTSPGACLVSIPFLIILHHAEVSFRAGTAWLTGLLWCRSELGVLLQGEGPHPCANPAQPLLNVLTLCCSATYKPVFSSLSLVTCKTCFALSGELLTVSNS